MVLAAGAVGLIALGDAAALSFVRASGLPALALMRAITDVGQSHWYLVPAALLFIGSAAADWRLRGRRQKARLAALFGQSAFVFAAVALSGLAANAVKFVIGRARPKLFDSVGAWHVDPFTSGYDHASFPSGHATTMGAVSLVLMLWFPRLRPAIAVLGLVAASTRIAAEAHYPSDVAGGFLFGWFFALILARALAGRALLFHAEPPALLPRLRWPRRRRRGATAEA